jgi:hypothetical protein
MAFFTEKSRRGNGEQGPGPTPVFGPGMSVRRLTGWWVHLRRPHLFARAPGDTGTRHVRAPEVRIPRGAGLGTNTDTFDKSLDRRGRSGLRHVCSSTRVGRRRTTKAMREKAWAFPSGTSGRNEGLSCNPPSAFLLQRFCLRDLSPRATSLSCLIPGDPPGRALAWRLGSRWRLWRARLCGGAGAIGLWPSR